MDPLESVKNIRRIERMMIDYQKIYTDKIPSFQDRSQLPSCGQDIIRMSINYGINACKATALLIENSQPQSAAVVVRPYLEMSLRMMWCVFVEKNWGKLVAYYAKQTLQAVNLEYKTFGNSPISSENRELLKKYSKIAEPRIPSISYMLKELQKTQGENNASTSVKETYSLFFKGSLHQLAHANLCYMSFDQVADDPYRLERSITRASLWIINSSHMNIGMTGKTLKSFVDNYTDSFFLK